MTRVVELYEGTGEYLEPQRVLDAFPEEQCDTALQSLRRLSDSGHIKAVTTQGMGQLSPQLLRITGVPEKGLRVSGAWPSDAELLADRIRLCSPNAPKPSRSRRSDPSCKPGSRVSAE